MGIFNRKRRPDAEDPAAAAGRPAAGGRADFVSQLMSQARQLPEQAQAMQAQALQQAAARSQAAGPGAAGAAAPAGPASWARQVMAILARQAPASSSAAPA
jgi:hypothetical protein